MTPGDGGYAWEKLHSAVLTLATNHGDLRSRLRDAHRYALTRLFKPPHHFPWPNIRERFNALMQQIEDDRLESLTDEELSRVATEIVGVYDEVAREQGSA